MVSHVGKIIFAASGINPAEVPRIDCHLHTNWTDGQQTVVEVHKEALSKKLNTILFSEHARKTSGDWFGEFAREVRALPSGICQALVGVECKVNDFDGSLDISQEVIRHCDLVMASVHRFPDEHTGLKNERDFAPELAIRIELELSLAVLNNPQIHILGHLFGMSYRRFHIFPSEDLIKRVIARAAECGVAVEINAHYHPDPWLLIRWCSEIGAKITLGSNAHVAAEVGRIIEILERR